MVGQRDPAQENMVAGPNIGYYPVRAGLSQFNAYLKGIIFFTCSAMNCCDCCLSDMGAVVFEVGLGHMSDASMVIGWASVPDASPLVAKGQMQG